VETYTNDRIVVRELGDGIGSVKFHYTVNGIRLGHESYDPITDDPKIMDALDEK
jgi:hypothetical protein